VNDPNDKTVRFALVPADAERDERFSAFLRSRRAGQVGGYVLTRTGVHAAQGNPPRFFLYEFGDWAKEPDKPRKMGVLTAISLLSTFIMLGLSVKYSKSSH
jgi:hypothetical protein